MEGKGRGGKGREEKRREEKRRGEKRREEKRREERRRGEERREEKRREEKRIMKGNFFVDQECKALLMPGSSFVFMFPFRLLPIYGIIK